MKYSLESAACATTPVNMKKSKCARILSRMAVVAIASAMHLTANAELVTLPLAGIATNESGAVLLQFSPGSFNSCGCLVVAGNSPGAKQILATAMLAKSLNQPIIVNRENRGGGGPWGISDYATEVRINY